MLSFDTDLDSSEQLSGLSFVVSNLFRIFVGEKADSQTNIFRRTYVKTKQDETTLFFPNAVLPPYMRDTEC